ncbi:unnamed protein product [Darwinula stevensoni]|uniref:Transmembrane protein 45B n=1 Tax=Darwinula stevensoni TaxID=69355 RepID=A0A7R8XHA6_9CRUS|nr:unnamed protein product [Darwinula stevensoni]CAG0892588.1 unnamed protein product [Darwinula stevensoni]
MGRTWDDNRIYGHLVVGCFWAAMSLWWLAKILQRWRKMGPEGFRISPFYCAGKSAIPVESIFKICIGVFYGYSEYYTGYDSNGSFVNTKNAHHMAVCAVLTMSGLVDLGIRWNVVVPEQLSYIFLMAVGLTDGWLMSVHNDVSFGEGRLGTDMHQAAGMDPMIGILFLTCEMLHPRSLAIALLRPIFGLHQGALFATMSFVLYQPCCPWDDRHVPIFHALNLGCYMLSAGLALTVAMLVHRGSRKSAYKNGKLPILC